MLQLNILNPHLSTAVPPPQSDTRSMAIILQVNGSSCPNQTDLDAMKFLMLQALNVCGVTSPNVTVTCQATARRRLHFGFLPYNVYAGLSLSGKRL